jgi:hypothetical protein
MLAKCADFFMKHKQHDKAVHLLVEAKRFEEVRVFVYGTRCA